MSIWRTETLGPRQLRSCDRDFPGSWDSSLRLLDRHGTLAWGLLKPRRPGRMWAFGAGPGYGREAKEASQPRDKATRYRCKVRAYIAASPPTEGHSGQDSQAPT